MSRSCAFPPDRRTSTSGSSSRWAPSSGRRRRPATGHPCWPLADANTARREQHLAGRMHRVDTAKATEVPTVDGLSVASYPNLIHYDKLDKAGTSRPGNRRNCSQRRFARASGPFASVRQSAAAPSTSFRERPSGLVKGDPHERILRPTVHPGRPRLGLGGRHTSPPGFRKTFTSRYVDAGGLRLTRSPGARGRRCCWSMAGPRPGTNGAW